MKPKMLHVVVRNTLKKRICLYSKTSNSLMLLFIFFQIYSANTLNAATAKPVFCSLAVNSSEEDLVSNPSFQLDRSLYSGVHLVDSDLKHIHVYWTSEDEVFGMKPTSSNFLSFIFEFLSSKEELQSAWPSTSTWGGIWTGRGKYIWNDNKPRVSFSFTLDNTYSFFIPEEKVYVDLWEAWSSNDENLLRKNVFNNVQSEKLNKNDLPYHSAFYVDYNFVGTLAYNPSQRRRAWDLTSDEYKIEYPWDPSMAEWLIINFDGVKNITVNIPLSLNLEYQDNIVFDYSE